MAYLKPIGKYSLRQDWLVETVGAKPGTRILTAETDAKKAANLSAETEFRDRAGTLKAPIPAQQVRGARTTFDPYDWVVGTTGEPLPSPIKYLQESAGKMCSLNRNGYF
jgi:hypothetical protein